VTATPAPALTVAKSSTSTTYDAAGDVIPFRVELTNTGNVTLSNATITDAMLGATPGWVCTDQLGNAVPYPTVIVPGGKSICIASYIVTQADVDAGSITNQASASAMPPIGSAVNVGPAEVTIQANQNLALSVVKGIKSGSGFASVGDPITFTFDVTNLGNVTLTNVVVNDGLAGIGAIGNCVTSGGAAVAYPIPTLATGGVVTCEATYHVTQADIDAGVVLNTATGAGSAPGGTAVTSPQTDVRVPATVTPGLELIKTTTASTFQAPGEVIPYKFDMANTGNVTLSNVVVTDAKLGAPITFSCVNNSGVAVPYPVLSIAVGEQASCIANYLVRQADINAGMAVNVATATGYSPAGDPVVSAEATVTVIGEQNDAISLVKTVVSQPFTTAGDVVTFAFDLKNLGNTTLFDVVIEDEVTTGGAIGTPYGCLSSTAGSVTYPVLALQPGEVVTCYGDYSATQADLDRNYVENKAYDVGQSGAGDVVGSDSVVRAPGIAAPKLTIAKSTTATQYSRVGDAIPYTVIVTNSGNQTLTGVTINDPLIPDPTSWSCGSDALPIVSMVPGASVTCTAIYIVTLADLTTMAPVVNLATASGTAPDGSSVVSDPTSASVGFSCPLRGKIHVVSSTGVNGKASPGGSFIFTVDGLSQGDVATGVINSNPIQLSSQTAGSSGSVTWTLTLPEDMSVGWHTVSAKSWLCSAALQFEVIANPSPPVPPTPSPSPSPTSTDPTPAPSPTVPGTGGSGSASGSGSGSSSSSRSGTAQANRQFRGSVTGVALTWVVLSAIGIAAGVIIFRRRATVD
jgi:uncharacterized repeat protein (TIGR01451 family)